MSANKKRIREKFRTDVFERDNHACKFCTSKMDLDAHHITDRNKMPNGGYVKSNGITLCPFHHQQAEMYHSTDGKDFIEGMHPDDLYKVINSTYEKARSDSERLKC